jgi:uncharacterized protein (DUF58 family)
VARAWSVTSRGVAFGTLGVLAGLIGLALHERQIVRIGAFLILLGLVAAVLLASSRRGLRTSASLSAPRVEAGRTVELHLTSSSTGRVPTATLGFEVTVPDGLSGGGSQRVRGPRPGVPTTLTAPLRALVRGRYEVPPVTVETRDALGLCRLRRPETTALALTVLPRTESLRGALPATGTVTHGSGGSRSTGTAGDPDTSVREYRSGDDRRRVHWRSTARLGELMVRGEEQQRQAAVTVLLDTRAGAHRRAGSRGSFEWAVGATASITRHLLLAGHQVRLEGAPDGDPRTAARSPAARSPATRSPTARVRAELERLVDARCSGERRQRNSPVAGVLPPPDRSVLVAVLGGITAADLPALRAARAGRPDALALLLDVDSWELGTARDVADARRDLEILAASLRRSGWRTAIAGEGSTVTAGWTALVHSTSRAARMAGAR